MMKNLISIAFLVCLLSGAGVAQDGMIKRAKTDALKIGETAPDFSLVSDAGKTVSLSKIKGPLVIVFYRAYW